MAAALACAVLAGCGGEERGSAGGLVWTETPRLLVAPRAPDRVLLGRVRNDSLRPLEIRAADVTARDARGRAIDVSIVFNDGFTKPLYPQDRGLTLPDFDKRRLGLIVALKPGQEAPLTVGWRQPSDSGAPARLDYAGGSLAIGATERVTESSRRRLPTGPAQRGK